MRILIVDDEVFSQQVLSGYLEGLNHEVISAAGGHEALQILEREAVRLVITDWLMPEMDGLELIRHIRAREDAHYVYTILLTAKSDSQDVVDGIMAGADDYLTKPYDRDELCVRVRAGERIVELENDLIAGNQELAEAKANLEKVNKRMTDDLHAAAKVQRALLPTSIPQSSAANLAWIYRPCDELAGDIFDVFKLDDSHVGFYLLDVSGHGVPAALLSVTLSRILSPLSGGSSVLFSNGVEQDQLNSPSMVATELNERFQMNDDYAQYFTMLFCVLNTDTNELSFVSAGHPGPVYIPRDGKPRILEAGGFPVGIDDTPEYTDEKIKLRPGDRIILYSDGLMDIESPTNGFYGSSNLVEFSHGSHQSIDAMMTELDAQLMSWCEGSHFDDISVLAMEMKDTEPDYEV